MIGIILIELISLISFIFSLLIFWIPCMSIDNFIAIFLWTLLVSSVAATLKKKNRSYLFTSLLIFLPIIKYRKFSDILFLFITVCYIYYYIFHYLGNIEFSFIKNKFERKLLYFIVIILLSIALKPGKTCTLFMIIYFISTIIFLRSLRHLEYNSNIKNINKANMIYIVSISILLLIISIDKLRNSLLCIYSFLIDIIFKILYWPIYWFSQLILHMMSLLNKADLDNQQQEQFSYDGKSKDLTAIKHSILPDWLVNTISIVSKLILIFLVIYIIYKLFKKKTSTVNNHKIGYIEEREFIKINKNKKEKKKISIFKPTKLSDQIRYYYKKYLIKAKKKGVNIKNSDTSLDVNIKAKENFDEKIIRSLRNIYIRTRYGEKEVTKDNVKEMKELYKKT